MSSQGVNQPVLHELDVRGMHKPDKHPTIFATYTALPVNGAFVLINDHDPKHLHEEFEAEHPGSYGWDYLNREIRDWRIKITKTASTPLPRVLVDTSRIDVDAAPADAAGVVWKLQPRERDLDSTIVVLSAGTEGDAHTGPDLDSLVHVVAGSGTLVTELGTVDLTPGLVLWLPRRSRRQFIAGAEGLQYLSVHQRRRALGLQS